jgi:hypothetical protein
MRYLITLLWITVVLVACKPTGSPSAVNSFTPVPSLQTPPAQEETPAKPAWVTPSPSLTPIADIAALLQEVQQFCWQGGQQDYPVEVRDGKSYSFGCPTSAGHSASATIEEFADASEAKAAFDEVRGGLAVECFHSYPAAYEIQEEGSLPWYVDHHYWQASRWLIITTSQNDTRFTQAHDLSGSLYRLAMQHKLFPPGTCAETLTP